MNYLKYLVVNVVETLLRGFPFSCKTGLVKIGNPGRGSPVVMTCNFHLTVARVKRALRGMDAYLLVANSRGINVWCAAAGGHLTNHDVISALKTTGIEQLADHRKVILPQLAAPGVEGRVIREKAGWTVAWGPVYASDIPAFVAAGFRKTRAMKQVRFPLLQRIEMAAMWSFPFSLVSALVVLPLDRSLVLPVIVLTWGLPFLMFPAFPLYSRWLTPAQRPPGIRRYAVIFDLGRVTLILWGVFLGCLAGYNLAVGGFNPGFTVRWAVVSLIVILLVSLDLRGSTPVYKSSLCEENLLTVVLDEPKCKGAGFCELVCPRDVFECDPVRHVATMPRSERCVRCGACIVQCPFDALYFQSPAGAIPPETTRKYKLNMAGKRSKKVAG